MTRTRIEWATHVWNPVTGCTPVSEGCDHCYARRMAKRLAGRCGYPADDPFRLTIHEDKIEEPLHWRKRRPKVFVCSMGDLFHEGMPWSVLMRIWNVMRRARDCKFIVLTKRPERMWEFVVTANLVLSNVWLGVTTETQERANKRIAVLLQIPAARRLVSVEPMLEPIDIVIAANSGPALDVTRNWLDWVIVGGETGPGARPMHSEWVRSLRGQCLQTRVPFFFKGWGEWAPNKLDSPDLAAMSRVGKRTAGRLLDGREWNEVPE